jgi:Zn-dependent protease
MWRSWKLGNAFGIGIYLHPTFLLLPLWVFFSSLPLGGLGQAGYALALLVPVFACVVLHELGHALMARRFGIATRHITLYPIGGVAQLERMSEKPWEEFWIAVAGPAVNVVIAFLLFWPLALSAVFSNSQEFLGYLSHRHVLFDLWLINVGLVIFNMVPAFPMDGGRVLRSLLATQFGYLRATEAAVWVGTLVAGLGALLSIVSLNPMGLFIAGFVFFMGRLELWALRQRQAARDRMLDALTPEDVAEVIPVEPDTPVQVYVWDSQLGGWVERGTRRPLSNSWMHLP